MSVSRRSFTTMAVILIAPFTAYIIFAALRLENLSNFASLVSAYIAAGILFFAYKKERRSQKTVFSFLLYAFACLTWAAADTIWAIIGFSGGNPEDNAALWVIYTLTNCIFFVSVVFYVFGQYRKWNFVQLAVDISFNLFFSILLFWLLFFEKDITNLAYFFKEDFTSIVSILTDIIIGISIYSWLSSIRSAKIPTFVILISVGLLFFTYADIIYYYMSFNGLYYPNQVNDVLYIFSLSLIAFGALWKIYLNKADYNLRDLINTGRRIKWFYLFIYPIFIIGFIKFGFSDTKLTLVDYVFLISPVIVYWALCRYIQHSILKEKALSASLAESERSKSTLLNNLPGMAYRCNFDPQWTMQFVSDGCLKLTGYAPERFYDPKNLTYNDIIAPEYRESIWDEWTRAAENHRPFKFEYEIIPADSKRKWVLEMGEGVYDQKGDVIALEGIILDITDRKSMEDDLRYISEHDVLTGLYNIFYLDSLLEKDCRGKDGVKRAIISINLNLSQQLAGNYGLHFSDSLMIKIAKTLSQYGNENRMLFKTGEKRFVFYMKNYKDKTELTELSEAIAKLLLVSFATERIAGGIGIVEIEQGKDEFDIDELRRKVITATERSTDIIDENFKACFYDKELELLVNRERGIREVLSAISTNDTGDELFLQYQPILDLRTESISGFEALARLKTTELGLVSPGEFIPIAEDTKLIIPIGEKIISRALDFLNRLIEEGFETLSVSINISVIQLLTRGFTDKLLKMIHEKQMNSKNIVIEITESVFAYDYDFINSVISKLREAGMHLAIDDFGTGYSSLSREKYLNIDCIKIDKTFIDHLLDFEKPITGDIIEIAHKQGHCVVAEGVEHVKQMQYLKEHGCNKIQGYLISRPLDEDAALKFLKEFGVT